MKQTSAINDYVYPVVEKGLSKHISTYMSNLQEFFKMRSKNIYDIGPYDRIVYGDITKIDSSEMPDDIDLVIGGFPCQGFSVANTKRSMKDERNFLYKEMLRVIDDKKPKFFVAENVKGILSMKKGKVFDMIKKDFKK